jgi:hypothetical protein
MSILLITHFQILFAVIAVIVLYISAIMILFKTKSGLLPYLALIFLPILGPLGIILGNYKK